MSCDFQIQFSDLYEDVLKLLRHVVYYVNVPVVDDDVLWGAAGILLGALADLNALDEGVEEFGGQHVYFRILSGVLQKAVEVGGGVLQFLQICGQLREGGFDVLLLCNILVGEYSVLLIGNPAKDVVLVETLEQGHKL